MNHKLHDNIDWFACGTDSEQLDQIGMRQQFHVPCLAKKLNLERKNQLHNETIKVRKHIYESTFVSFF